MDKKELIKAFDSFNNLNILIIGDVMIDHYLWGNVNRISPEAPVPVVLIKRKENRLGGAANVALNIKALGANPILCSAIGVDDMANEFLDLLRKEKMSPKGIMKCRGRVTTTKTRIIGNGHQMLRFDEETESQISSPETNHLLNRIYYMINHENIHAVVFQDYDKGLVTPKLIKEVISLARKKNVPVVVDPKKKNFYGYKSSTLFKPNLKELIEGTKSEFDGSNMKQLKKIAETFRKEQKIETIMITLSEKGIYINSNEADKLIPAHVRNVSDVSGAGDTVISVTAVCKAIGLNDINIAQLANLGGGIVCEQTGVVPVNKKQLLKEAVDLFQKKKQ